MKKTFEEKVDDAMFSVAMFSVAVLVVVNVGRYILERNGLL